MQIQLKPDANLTVRKWVLAVDVVIVLCLPIFTWWIRLLACIPIWFIAGTYRVSSFQEDKFRSQLFVGFVPMKVQKCNLPGVVYIEIKFNAVGHTADPIPVLGPIQMLIGMAFDVLTPALGGAYEIWLVTAKGREIPAWQGISEKHFDENLELLKSASGAEVRTRAQ